MQKYKEMYHKMEYQETTRQFIINRKKNLGKEKK